MYGSGEDKNNIGQMYKLQDYFWSYILILFDE